MVPDVTDVLVSLLLSSLNCVKFSRVALIGKMFYRSPFLSPKNRAKYESSQVKAPPMSRRRMTPPAHLPHSYASFEGEQRHHERTRDGVREKEK